MSITPVSGMKTMQAGCEKGPSRPLCSCGERRLAQQVDRTVGWRHLMFATVSLSTRLSTHQPVSSYPGDPGTRMNRR